MSWGVLATADRISLGKLKEPNRLVLPTRVNICAEASANPFKPMETLAKLGIRVSQTLLLFAFSVVVTSYRIAQNSSNSDQRTEETRESAFLGCYELTLGRWWPWSFGGDTLLLVTPPKRVRLLQTRGALGFERDKFLIRPLPHSGPGRGGPSYWEPRSEKQVDLIWADGFTGIVINLEKKGDELRGWVHPFFDSSTLIKRKASIVAQKIACPALSDNPAGSQ